MTISNIGMLAAALTTAAYIPQAYKIIKTRSANDLSLITFTMLFVGTVLWFIYGLYFHDTPLMLANGVTATLSGIIFFLKISSFGKKRRR
jgi:MtN3 and saliva related transmembrane protein